MPYFFNQPLRKTEIILRNLKRGNVLNLGCADVPQIHQYLKDNVNGKVIGIDVKKTKVVDFIHDLNKPIKFIKNNSFDNVVMGDVIEHVYEIPTLLRECHRILRNRGRLIITTPNSIGINYILNNMTDSTHVITWNKFHLKKYIEYFGFRCIHLSYKNIHYNLNPLRVVGFLFKRFRPMILGIFEKIT